MITFVKRGMLILSQKMKPSWPSLPHCYRSASLLGLTAGAFRNFKDTIYDRETQALGYENYGIWFFYFEASSSI